VEIITFKKIINKFDGVDKLFLIFLMLGVAVLIISLFRGILMTSQVQIEYLKRGSDDNKQATNKIFVDLEGQVIHPGVYELEEGSRVKDVLVMAGGLAESADREFCEKTLNLAEDLKDGQKIYIPKIEDTPSVPGYSEAKLGSKLINVNTASVQELDTLWGVGESRSNSIVKNRPYKTLDELVSKGAVTKSILERNIEVLSVY